MNKLLWISSAPVVFVAFVAWRHLRGRPLSRHALNIYSSLFLLGYFAATAGLGIFWVANQELPAFDLHYLFGYVTLCLLAAHLAFNGRVLAAFFRKKAPSQLVMADRHQWKPAWRLAWKGMLLTVFGAISFLLGQRAATRTIRVEPAVEITAASASSDKLGKSPGDPVPIPRVMVDTPEGRIPLAEYYNDQVQHTRASVVSRSGGIDWSNQPSVYKSYPDAETVDLPRDFELTLGVPLTEAVENRYGLPRAFDPGEPMSLVELSNLLTLTNGITGGIQTPQGIYYLRAAPSGGALYPTVIYVLVNRVEGLEPGLYHYAIDRHSLHRVKEGASSAEIAPWIMRGDLVRSSHVTVFLTAIFYRTSWKYGAEKSFRYVCLDVGHVAGNLTLAASTLGYAVCMVGGFDDSQVNTFLGIDEKEEAALLVIPVGKAVDGPDGPEKTPVFQPAGLSAQDGKRSLMQFVQFGTRFRAVPGAQIRPWGPESRQPKPYEGHRRISLPEPERAGMLVVETIARRRSSRTFTSHGVPLESLSSLLFYSAGWKGEGGVRREEFAVDGIDPLEIYVVVNKVRGIEPGIYYYDRLVHELVVLRTGSFRQEIYEAGLFQEVVGASGVVFVKTVDYTRMAARYGDRGYRYANLQAGVIGNTLYLESIARGLGVTGIGAFFEGEVDGLLDLDRRRESTLYLTAVGVPTG
ncbi:MAG: SagB/ThcOx family dehydrogenase [Candidatus Latescibacteria bacterium]|nr:SagB/ThcOx family dehydrogenase [Candidatus Latescibacterota bacterium]